MADAVDDIKNKIEIVSFIGNYIDLKKAGKNWKGLCPFHSEKTPSFTVSNEIQGYKCFGCGESGDIFTFLKKYENMDFFEALVFLAEKAGVELENYGYDKRDNKKKLIEINELVSRFYSYILLKHPAGKTALEYLRNRGIGNTEIQEFKLGFSPNQPFALKQFVVEKNKISTKDLVELGIVYQGDSGPVDRFRGRVIFPLTDQRGNIIGFAGRILPEFDNGRLAKYINSPETPLYHKSSVLYGLDIAKDYIRRSKRAVVVEGELDMISSWKTGIKNTVAIKGTALTLEQATLLSRFSDEIVLALDADAAGSGASRRGIEIAEKEGLNVKVAVFDAYKDPDEAARKDPKYLLSRIENPIGIWDFLIGLVLKDDMASTGSEVAKLSRSVVPILSSIKDKIVQSHYIGVVSKKLGVDAESVAKQIEMKGRVPEEKRYTSLPETLKKDRKTKLEERLFALMLSDFPEKLIMHGSGKYFTTHFIKRLFKEFLIYADKAQEFDIKGFSEHMPAELKEGFRDIVMDSDNHNDDTYLPQVEVKLIKRELRTIYLKEKMKTLYAQISKSEIENDSNNVSKLQNKFQKAAKKLSKLEELKSKGIIH